MKRPSRPLSALEVRAMFARARGRERVMMILLWRAGLRNAEACAMQRSDVELAPDGTARLHIRHGKGDKARFGALDKRATDVLRGWLEAETTRGLGGYLLSTKAGQPLHTSQIRRTVKTLAGKAGVLGWQDVHPHALRHRFARELHDEGVGIRVIQVLLGHDSLATTQKYLQSIGCDEAIDLAARREW